MHRYMYNVQLVVFPLIFEIRTYFEVYIYMCVYVTHLYAKYKMYVYARGRRGAPWAALGWSWTNKKATLISANQTNRP